MINGVVISLFVSVTHCRDYDQSRSSISFKQKDFQQDFVFEPVYERGRWKTPYNPYVSTVSVIASKSRAQFDYWFIIKIPVLPKAIKKFSTFRITCSNKSPGFNFKAPLKFYSNSTCFQTKLSSPPPRTACRGTTE